MNTHKPSLTLVITRKTTLLDVAQVFGGYWPADLSDTLQCVSAVLKLYKSVNLLVNTNNDTSIEWSVLPSNRVTT